MQDFAYIERARRNTKHTKGQTSSWHMLYRAGEGGTQTVAEERNLSSRQVWGYEEGGRETQGRRPGQTEASRNPYDGMRIKSSLSRPRVWRKKANGNRKDGTTARADSKRRNRSQERNTKTLLIRVFPPVSSRGTQGTRDREARRQGG